MKLIEMPSHPDDFLLNRNLTVFIISFLVHVLETMNYEHFLLNNPLD